MHIHLATAGGIPTVPASTRQQTKPSSQAASPGSTAPAGTSAVNVVASGLSALRAGSLSVQPRSRSPFALLIVVLAHVLLLITILTVRHSTSTVVTPPLFVSLIPDVVQQTTPDVTPPQPKALTQAPAQPQIAPPPVLIATESNTPAPISAPPVSNTNAKTSTAPNPVTTSTTNAVAVEAAPAVSNPASAPTAPIFNADYLNNPAPKYPPISRKSGEEGKVLLRVFVDPSGAPGTIEIHHTSGFERLDKAALAAVRYWKFVPARQGGEAVGAWVLVPIIFSVKT